MEVEKVSHKRHRKRSSNLMLQIRQQMEFYFSDSNLNKDRFLKQQLEQAADGYLPLELFLKFNKIRAMTGDVSNLAKALSKSQLLQVSEDLLKVRRTTEIRKPTDIDDRTVYVECLPAGVNHDWVKEAFSECGKVLYVSLPKYKTSGDIKGFAFVEFDSRESADKACAIMNNPPATAPELVGIFPRAGKEEKRLEKQVERLEKSSEKRKRRASESELNEGKSDKSQSKRRRTESSGGGDKIELTSSADSVHPKTKTKSDSKSENSAETNTSSFVAVSSDKEEGSSDFVGKKNKKRKQEQQASAADNVVDGCDKTVDAIKCVSPPDSLPEPKKKKVPTATLR